MTGKAAAPGGVGGNGELALDGSTARFSWALRSGPGCVRDHNEDFGGASVIGDERAPLFVVADGLGGHAAGEVASRVAVEVALGQWTSSSPGAPSSALRNAVRCANTAVFDASLEQGRRGMGTTIVAATLAGHEVVLAHVGDSRAYLVRDDRCAQLTADHSRVAEMVRMKLLTPEQGAVHPSRSMLTRSLGAEPMVQVDVNRHPIENGDVLVLCTDGVWDMVSRNELAQAREEAPSDAAARLAELAMERGAPDNVTALVVTLTSAEPIPAPSGRRSLFRRRG
jgi:protein phosphatase